MKWRNPGHPTEAYIQVNRHNQLLWLTLTYRVWMQRYSFLNSAESFILLKFLQRC